MSHKELDRLDIFKKLTSGQLNGTQVAECLKLTTRHIRRLKAGYSTKGAVALTHAGRGKPSNRRLPQTEKNIIADLLKSKYADFKPGFASEKLAELHHIKHDPKTIRQIMIELELWQPRRHKVGGQYHAWRQRKDSYGQMIQYDGSYEFWFENRSAKCCLLASIDDATGRVDARFGQDEGTLPTMAYWHDYIAKYGKPQSIYVDKFSTYAQNHAVAKYNADNLTQFARAMQEVGIDLIKANSPQAKGRVERLFLTLQDRLVKELRLAGISTIVEANEFLQQTFLPAFNARFTVIPKSKANLHRKLSKNEMNNLSSILSRQNQRVVQNDFTIAHDKVLYQILHDQRVTICRKNKIIVEERFDGSLHLRLRGKYLNYKIIPQRPQKQKTVQWVIAASGANDRRTHKPKADHPWKKQFIYANSLSNRQVGHF